MSRNFWSGVEAVRTTLRFGMPMPTKILTSGVTKMFSNADAYEVNMGRWSQQLAPLFIEFAGIRDGDRMLDVGCGTGSLSLALAGATRRSEIVGIDPSARSWNTRVHARPIPV